MDFIKYIKSEPDKIWRFLIYRRMFTPYEQECKFMDDGEFIDDSFNIAKIKEIFSVGSDFIIVFDMVDSDSFEPYGCQEIYKLSEIRLSSYECDIEEDCMIP